jgi:hypothetical protein
MVGLRRDDLPGGTPAAFAWRPVLEAFTGRRHERLQGN